MATVFVLHQITYDFHSHLELIGAAMGKGKLLDVIDERMSEDDSKLTLRLTEINTFDQAVVACEEIHKPSMYAKPFWRKPCNMESDSNRSVPLDEEL